MKFSWDLEKEKTNRRKHHVTFSEACYVFADRFAITIYDEAHSTEEERWVTIGEIPTLKLLVVIHTHKISGHSEYVRIISARKAQANEARAYMTRRG